MRNNRMRLDVLIIVLGALATFVALGFAARKVLGSEPAHVHTADCWDN